LGVEDAGFCAAVSLIIRYALALLAFFSILSLILLAHTRLSGEVNIYGTTVTLRHIGLCSITVESDHTWTILVENRWQFRVSIPDNVRFKPDPCQVYSIIFYQGKESMLAMIQIPGGLIPIPLSKQALF
jgi:hypothetical protein